LETLDSIKAQTYDNIELIISDDYSSDNTVDICREWLSKHKDSFVSVKLITSDKNTGIAPNANRGWYQARGE
jgi:alpha-1,3-rhamnosyltransferase